MNDCFLCKVPSFRDNLEIVMATYWTMDGELTLQKLARLLTESGDSVTFTIEALTKAQALAERPGSWTTRIYALEPGDTVYAAHPDRELDFRVTITSG